MKNVYLFFTAILMAALIAGCKSNDDVPVSKNPRMLKLASPILINYDSTVVELADYLQRPGKIDSMTADPTLSVTLSADSARMTIKPTTRDFPRLSTLTIWSEGFPYSLLLEKTTKTRFWFTFDPKNKKYKRVQIAGQMNDWNPAQGYMFQKDNKWIIDLDLFPGKYQYKLILDGNDTDPATRFGLRRFRRIQFNSYGRESEYS